MFLSLQTQISGHSFQWFHTQKKQNKDRSIGYVPIVLGIMIQ